MNIINEWYAKDTSKKIRAVFRAKGESGKPLCTNPPYGYMKDSNNKNKWVVDEEAAKIVQYIFSLCIEGYGPTQIAKRLTRERVLIPAAYWQAQGRLSNNSIPDNPCAWISNTVARILSKPEYLGHTFNFKTFRKSYKDKKSGTTLKKIRLYLRIHILRLLRKNSGSGCRNCEIISAGNQNR